MKLDTIAVFHCGASNVCAWACADGIVSTLSSMGYNLIDCRRPSQKDISVTLLERADLIILSGPEFFHREIREKYGDAWDRLPARKVTWNTESAYRDDAKFDFRAINSLAHSHYYPAVQDAEEFGGRWLPFGADVAIFRPRIGERTRVAGFVGTLYSKRVEFLRRINTPLAHIKVDQHRHARRSFELLAEAYCSTKIFVNLPALSRLLVTKITEVMACRTMLITPKLDHASALANMNQFEDGRHLVYYDAEKPEQLGELVRYYAARVGEAEYIAEAGCAEVQRSHSLEARLRKILADVEFDTGGLARISQSGVQKPVQRKFFRLLTHSGSIAYYDNASRTIRHAPPDHAPNNLRVQVDGLRGRLVALDESQRRGRQLYFLRDGTHWVEPGRTSATVAFYDGPSTNDCDLEPINDRLLIRHANNFLSADQDGFIRNDRSWFSDWERFELLEP